MGLFRPSGGVIFHLRAWRQQRLWQPFNVAIAQWLESWEVPREELILVGPSGGYTLPQNWLRSFRQIHAYDTDPLAAWMFGKRHPFARAKFHRTDVFWKEGRLSLSPLKKMLKEHPKASVAFCNLLGQLPLEGEFNEHQWEIYLNELRLLMKDRHWASYHDLATIEPLPLDRHQIVLNEYANSDGKDLKRALGGMRKKNVMITDHLMRGRWTADLEKRLFAWSLTPKSLHVIEGVRA